MTTYRGQFSASGWRKTPYAILGVAVVCADTDAEAERLASTIELNFLRRSKGEYLPLASPEDALAYPYTPIDRERMRQNRARLFVGTPQTVMARLRPLLDATKADEVMVTTMVHDHNARRRSYELLAEAFGLVSPADAALTQTA
jgi:alkanesulfonate monooxygenase SsuD/methylene tetrahydromethanopterin reductase-like flavin-dependent oxidoreductase (luciferase family)